MLSPPPDKLVVTLDSMDAHLAMVPVQKLVPPLAIKATQHHPHQTRLSIRLGNEGATGICGLMPQSSRRRVSGASKVKGGQNVLSE